MKKHLTYAILILLISVMILPTLNAETTKNKLENQFFLNGSDDVNYAFSLLILTPKNFLRQLKPLYDHKNELGITTKMVTLREVYDQTSSGRDEAEKIKYFIKQAIESWNTQYVLLVGGMKHQRFNSWHLPVRYVGMDDDWEHHYVSDLYFADIYDSTGNFSSWDSDGDGIYGEWPYDSIAEDQDIDLYPDVYVGRLPCRNKYEVKIMVNKIITYENEAYGNPWFNDMICIAGDTYPEHLNPLWVGYEGEYYADRALENMSDFNPVTLYASDETFTGQKDVINAVNQGCGFLYFVGHGNPKSWGNHPPDGEEFIDGLSTYTMHKLKNKEKLPVCVVSGCHNSQFDVSLWRILNRRSRYLGEAAAECWGWRMTRRIGGGSIATVGCSALGYTKEDKVSFSGGLNELESLFFKAYGQDDITIVGETFSTAITSYLDTYTPIHWNTTAVGDSFIDVKVVQSWVLFGDPSLQIGGYNK